LRPFGSLVQYYGDICDAHIRWGSGRRRVLLAVRGRRLKWELRTTVGQYEKSGRHDQKWDAPAKEALTLYSRWRSGPLGQSDDLARQIGRRCQEAVAGGCSDRWCFYVHAALVINRPGHSAAENRRAHWKVAAELKASRYSSLRKFYGFLRAGEHLYLLKPVPKLDVTEMMNDAAAQLAIALEGNEALQVELDQAAHASCSLSIRCNQPELGLGQTAAGLEKEMGANYAAELRAENESGLNGSARAPFVLRGYDRLSQLSPIRAGGCVAESSRH